MNLDEAFRHALDGQAVLFLGAGYSKDARTAEGANLPTGPDLAELLTRELGLTDELPLDIASDMFIEQRGESQLIQLLNKHLTADEITAEQKIFGTLPWQRAYTTNYDHVLELAYQQSGRKIRSVTLADSPSDLAASAQVCVHINGSIERLNTTTLRSEFILTKTSYLSDIFNHSRWSRLFREDIEVARSVIFVGYSLYDLDVARVLFSTDQIREKCCFVVSEAPTRETTYSLSRFGHVIASGAAAAGRRLAELGVSHVAAAPSLVFHSFRVPSFSPAVETVSSSDLFDLYVKGELRTELLPGAFASPQSEYYIPRQELRDVFDYFDRNAPAVVLLSYLANGKTLLAQGVAFQALQRGWRALEFDRERRTIAAECEAIRRSTQPTLVIFENYQRHFDVLQRLVLQPNPQLRLLLTSRTPSHLTSYEKLQAILSPIEPVEIEIDRLAEHELTVLDRIFEHSGLLGDRAALSVDRRLQKLRVDCNSEFQNILLWLVDAPHIKARINEIFERLATKPVGQKLVVAAMALQHIGAPSDLGLMAEVCDVARVNQFLFSRDPDVVEFLKVDRDKIVARSSLFAAHALRAFWPSGIVPAVLAEILKRALELRFDGQIYREIARGLMRFSNVTLLVPHDQRHQRLIAYYESIRNFDGCARNQFFWLQYAIARLAMADFPLADRYLTTAYALASKIENFDTYQLDNTKARYLLTRCIAGLNTDGAVADFREAHAILSRQMRTKQHGYYPFRVAAQYGPFWDSVARAWRGGTREYFRTACEAILSRISAVDRHLVHHPDVARCHAELERVLGQIAR